MTSIRKPGPDSTDQAATHGGPGWIPREDTHADEIRAGRLWAPYRVCSEVAPLRAVLLAWPGDELEYSEPPDHWLMMERVDLAAIRRQARDIVSFFEHRGIAVHLVSPGTLPPPNLIFMRDLLFMTPEGAVLGRPAAQQRAGEERYVVEALAGLGVPLLRSMRGEATFEGADALWLDETTVMVGVGLRTNEQALGQLKEVLEPMGVEVVPIPLATGGVQHLLGVVVPVTDNQAIIRAEKAPRELLDLLEARDVRTVDLPDDEEMTRGRGANVVTLAPGEVVMPADCPGIRRRLRDAGFRVRELDVSEYVKAAGALGCLTGILWRG